MSKFVMAVKNAAKVVGKVCSVNAGVDFYAG